MAAARCARLEQIITAASLSVLITACGGGGGDSPAPAPAPVPVPAPVPAPAPVPTPPGPPPSSAGFTITGTATYDSVPANANGRGLNYAGASQKPIRGANVELLAAGGAVLSTAATDALGRYSVSLGSAQAVTVRVRAEIKPPSSSSGNREFTVRDNTNGEALYVLDSAALTPTAATTTLNLNAASGWGGSSYTGTRSAAPFAILDVVYAAVAKIATVAPAVTLPPLKLFWSPNNFPSAGAFNAATGAIQTSQFRASGTARSLYLLGKENTDTDEYDDHVVAHEFGHYLQSALSRDDSVGGSHSTDDRLDMRLAFSEGWGNAWSGMALGSPVYADSSGNGQATGFFLNVGTAPVTNRGAYSEGSAQYLLWTVHQDAAIGFGPVYAALRALTTEPTFTSLYSFAQRLKNAVPAASSTITSLWAGQQVVAQDAVGTGETNNGGDALNLPVYKTYSATATNTVCVNTSAGADPVLDGNKLGRYGYILIAASGNRTITATRSAGNFAGASDPDLLLLKSDGSEQSANADTTPTQVLTTTLPTGTHVLALEDFNLTSPSNSCFNITVN